MGSTFCRRRYPWVPDEPGFTGLRRRIERMLGVHQRGSVDPWLCGYVRAATELGVLTRAEGHDAQAFLDGEFVVSPWWRNGGEKPGFSVAQGGSDDGQVDGDDREAAGAPGGQA